jgi:hypothetical protein
MRVVVDQLSAPVEEEGVRLVLPSLVQEEVQEVQLFQEG